MGNELVRFLRSNVEDICIVAGVLFVALGVSLAFGFAFGLIAFGALIGACGVWMTVGGSK